MTTAALSATDRATDPPTGSDHAPHLLGGDDLDDESRFKIYKRVPILDVNEDAERGTVDEDMLHTIAKNSNKRVEGGDPPSLILGHTRRKQTLIVVRPDGSKIVFPASEEEGQPDIVGFSKNHTVDSYHGNPCLYGDFHIHTDHLDKASKFPFRSVERVEKVGDDDDSSHYIDRVALLKTPPQRDLGILQYEQETGGDGGNPATPQLLRIAYAREFPPLESERPAGDESAPGPSDAPPDSDPNDNPSPTEEFMPLDDVAPPADSAAQAPDDAAEAPPQTIGEMDAGEFFQAMAEAVAESLRSVLSEHLEDDGGDQGEEAPPAPDEDHTDYESDDVDPEMDDDEEMTQYEGEAGGDNTMIPTEGGIGEPCDKKARHMYAKLAQDHSVLAKGQTEHDEILIALFDKVQEMEHRERRHNYEKRLDSLVSDGYEIDAECKGELLNDLAVDAPEGYEDRKESEIRKRYARKAIGRPVVPVAAAEVAPMEDSGITVADRRAAIAYSTKNGCSFTEGLKAVKAK